MTTVSVDSARSRAFRGLRLQLYIVILLLTIETVLGIAVNLFAKLPASDTGDTMFSAFGAAIGSGPVSLAVHAIVGALVVLAGISVLIRAAGSRSTLQTVLAIIGLLAMVGAWISGATFVGAQSDGTSFGMTMATALAVLVYATALFAVPAVRVSTPA